MSFKYGDHPCESLLTEIRSIVEDVVTDRTFAVGGPLPPSFPPAKIVVKDVGRNGMPVSREQAAVLASVASASPHGHQSQTVVDPELKCVDLDASLVRTMPQWDAAILNLARDASKRMDLSTAAAATVQPRLDKLTLYDVGGAFVECLGIENKAGIFGTLVVQLPPEYMGGALTMRYHEQEKRFWFDGPDSADGLYHPAFFAEVFPAMSPIESGMRICLVYHLVRPTQGPPLSIASDDELVA
ncbi:hypothetical protein BDK51DRAFT_34949 [Blyttiomyces helicus]|uniref:Uncharacterized protein n=1 Tax=Blyttiomyces helicus TaxID=388810 RepID=A0A4P9W4P3_9FUNG|nr:hypothetical protein BDK51DRAFT_34949 [Blyttiomyces helicus]|eukprot:RKO85838.1 hypothetical protein BDK51DRAFT_34949 [Blyttiomyces helicus]